MAIYKKKPCPVQAIQLTWENWDRVCEFVPAHQFAGGVYLDEHGKHVGEFVGGLLKGTHSERIGLRLNYSQHNLAVQGEYLIKGDFGDVYVRAAESFETEYELADSPVPLHIPRNPPQHPNDKRVA